MTKKLTQAIFRHFKATRYAHALSTTPVVDSFTESIGEKIVPAENLKQLREIPGPAGLASLPYVGPAFLFHPFSKCRL